MKSKFLALAIATTALNVFAPAVGHAQNYLVNGHAASKAEAQLLASYSAPAGQWQSDGYLPMSSRSLRQPPPSRSRRHRPCRPMSATALHTGAGPPGRRRLVPRADGRPASERPPAVDAMRLRGVRWCCFISGCQTAHGLPAESASRHVGETSRRLPEFQEMMPGAHVDDARLDVEVTP
jgi:hypothetical protein